MADLEGSLRPSDLVPLDAAAVGRAAGAVEEIVEHLRAAHRRLGALDPVDGWRGAAGDRYARVAERMPRLVAEGTEALGDAAGALRDLEAAILEAVQAADRAQATAREGWRQTRQWRRDREADLAGDCVGPPLVPRDDPGAPLRRRAGRGLDAALGDLDAARRATVETLVAVSLTAPGLGAFSKSVGRSVLDLGGGFVGAAADTAGMLVRLNPARLLVDHDGYGDDLGEVGDGIRHLVENPGEVDDVVLDLETLRENPEEWAGSALFDLSTVPITAGTGTAASVASRTASRLGRIPARSAPRITRSLTRIDRTLGRLRLPSVTALTTSDRVDAAMTVTDRVRAAGTHRLTDPEAREYAESHGGRAEDYQRRRARLRTSDGTVTVGFVEHVPTGRPHDVEVLVGTPPDGA